MPLIFTKNNSGAKVVVWEITESKEELLDLYTPLKEETKKFKSIIAETKIKQWLSVRILLNEINPEGIIIYDEYNKPHLSTPGLHISISHTNKYATIIVDNKGPVGIDIESPSNKVLAVMNRFMSEAELNNVSVKNKIPHTTLYWCAKEVVYKLYGKKQIEFKSQITINPFPYSAEGSINANLVKDNINKFYKLYHQNVNECKLVYSLNE